MSEAVFLLIIFILVCTILACIRQRREAALRRQEEEAIGLPQFRQAQQERRRQQQGTSTTTTTIPTIPTPTTAPTEQEITQESRKQVVHQHLYHRVLQHGESVRNLSMLLAAANDRYQDTEGSMIARTWRSAESSVNKFVGINKPECSICLENYQAHETVCWAKNDECHHIFHQDCIVQWLLDHDDCPLCRTNLLEYNQDCNEDSDEQEQEV